jgi:N-methylhydantoinase A
MRIGVDTGGTFTDLVAIDDRTGEVVTFKTSSTPSAPEDAVFDALEGATLDADAVDFVSLGTTTGANAYLEHKGARVAYLTTEGFQDVPFIQRIVRRYAYDPTWRKPDPGVDRADCIGVRERTDKHGTIVLALDDAELERVVEELRRVVRTHDGPMAVAINFLFSYLNPENELQTAAAIRAAFHDMPISVSHGVARIWREYERSTTTIIDASIKPNVSGLAGHVEEGLRERDYSAPLSIMKSNGGQLSAASASRSPIQLLLSGLSGGVIGGRFFAAQVGVENAVTFDMGGTSTDVGLIVDGRYGYTTEYEAEWGIPISAPFIDFHAIGAGGGSIAWEDFGGLLRVGPQSAGASPGPVCYGRGGTEPTVTDANLVLGRLDPAYFLGGRMDLDADLARGAFEQLGARFEMSAREVAHAVLSTVSENMAGAIRLVTVERGIDHRDFSLVAFGGAGPMHAAQLIRSLGMPQAVVPLHPGLCSAFGAALADRRVDLVRTVYHRSDGWDPDALSAELEELTAQALDELAAEGYDGEPELRRTLALRYLGQNYEEAIAVPDAPLGAGDADAALERFHAHHAELYGFQMPGDVVEVTQLSVTAVGALELPELPKLAGDLSSDPAGYRESSFSGSDSESCPVYRRERLPAGFRTQGPAIVEEPNSTTVVLPDQQMTVSPHGLLVIREPDVTATEEETQ